MAFLLCVSVWGPICDVFGSFGTLCAMHDCIGSYIMLIAYMHENNLIMFDEKPIVVPIMYCDVFILYWHMNRVDFHGWLEILNGDLVHLVGILVGYENTHCKWL